MENPRHWRLKQQRYALMGQVCNQCNAKIFPPREICPECGIETKATILHRAQAGAVEFPVMNEVSRS